MENPFEIILERLDRIERLLINQAQKPNALAEDGNEFMNIKEVSAYLYLSVATIYGKVSKGELPNYKRGKRLMFKKSEIDDWITKGKRMSYDEIKEAANIHMAGMKRRRS